MKMGPDGPPPPRNAKSWELSSSAPHLPVPWSPHRRHRSEQTLRLRTGVGGRRARDTSFQKPEDTKILRY